MTVGEYQDVLMFQISMNDTTRMQDRQPSSHVVAELLLDPERQWQVLTSLQGVERAKVGIL